jgi:hypothetical protein
MFRHRFKTVTTIKPGKGFQPFFGHVVDCMLRTHAAKTTVVAHEHISESRFGYYIVMREGTRLPAKVKRFRDWKIDEVQEGYFG